MKILVIKKNILLYLIKKYSNNGFNDDNREYNIFMREMNKFKQRKLKQWRKEFLEDNEKY